MIRAPVPETTVNHHGYAGLAEQDVSATATWTEERYIHPVSQSAAVELSSQCHLRGRVPHPLALEPSAYGLRLRCWDDRFWHSDIMPDLPAGMLRLMPQDDEREKKLTDLFNLRVPENRRRDETDAFLHIDGLELPFELKSTTKSSVGTVRDFGAKHVAKWKNLHWIFGFYNKGGKRLLYCQYASPADMAPWVREKEQYVWPDAVLELTAGSLVTGDTLAKIFDPPKEVYSLDDAKSIMKHQWRVAAYKANQDLPNGYSPERMVEMLKERCTYVIHRGGTLNNPKIPKSYFASWEKITEEHAERLRQLVRAYLAASASETDTATA